jgi:hypothetical protein
MNAVILRNILAFFNIDELVINTCLSYSIRLQIRAISIKMKIATMKEGTDV